MVWGSFTKKTRYINSLLLLLLSLLWSGSGLNKVLSDDAVRH